MAWGSTSQILDVTNSAISQMMNYGYNGSTDLTLTALTDTDIVELGNNLVINSSTLESSESPLGDIFFKALLNQIGQVLIDTREYQTVLPKLYKTTTEWGLAMESVKIDLADLMIDEAWNPDGFKKDYTISGGVASSAEGERLAGIEFGTYKPDVHARLYKKAHGLMAALTLARQQMFSCFKSAAQYETFVSGLYASVNNALTKKSEVYALMTMSVAIATAIINGNDIHLCTEWLALGGTDYTATPNLALKDPDFLRYAAYRIVDVKDNLRQLTNAYNDGNSVTFSTNPNLVLLNKFSNAVHFFSRADTYHRDEIGFGDFDRVSTWQAIVNANNPFDYDAVTAISLTGAAIDEISGTTGSADTTYENIIGVLYDPWAAGINVEKVATESQRSAAALKTNVFFHNLCNYFVNPNYAIVAFRLD